METSFYDPARTSFSGYLQASDEKPLVGRTLARLLKTGLLKRNSPETGVSIADFGCHDGRLTRLYLEGLGADLPPRSVIHAVEPCETALQSFRKAGLGWEGAPEVRFHPMTAEVYLDRFSRNDPELPLDYGIFVQSLYWSPRLTELLRQASECCTRFLVVINAGPGIHDIRRGFRPELTAGGFHLHSGASIQAAVEDLGLESSLETIRASVSVPQDEAGFRAFASFLLQTPMEHLGSEPVAKLRELLEDVPTFENEVAIFSVNGRI